MTSTPTPESLSYRQYYEAANWPEFTSEAEQLRFASVVNHIPAGVASALEIGCGDGRLSYHLPFPSSSITFTDLSESALRLFRRPNAARVQASADVLPFADNSFDLVICSEVLEHLPPPVFERARKEIARVSSRFALVTVPYRENLRAEAHRCAKCGRIYHAYGHLRSFDKSEMANLLPEFPASKIWTFGPLPRWPWPLALLRAPRSGYRCDRCGHQAAPIALSFDQKILDWMNTNCVAPWYRRPYWIGALYSKVSPTSSVGPARTK